MNRVRISDALKGGMRVTPTPPPKASKPRLSLEAAEQIVRDRMVKEKRRQKAAEASRAGYYAAR